MIRRKILPLLVAMLMISSIGASAAANSSFNTTQISKSAGDVKYYVDTLHSLPSNVSVVSQNGSQNMTPSQFLYLLTTDTQRVNSGNTTPITLKNVNKPSSPTETVKSGTIAKSEYLTIASKINSFITANGRLPNYVNTTLGTMRYESLIYMYSKILNYYAINKVLPNTVSILPWKTLTNTAIPTPITVTDTSHTTTKVIGNNSNGTVYKIGPFGNGTNKVAIIIGVHPQEGVAHLAMMNALKSLASSLHNVQIWVFQVFVNTKYISDYSLSRSVGQSLASKYVVPNIDSTYKLAMDTHGNRGYYYSGNELMSDFVFAPSKGALSTSYANKIIQNTNFLKYYYVADGSSPQYVTIPIANKGIPAIVYEVYMNIPNYPTVLYNDAVQVVKAINKIFAS